METWEEEEGNRIPLLFKEWYFQLKFTYENTPIPQVAPSYLYFIPLCIFLNI